MEGEDLRARGAVVQVSLDLHDLGLAQLAVDVGREPAHRLFAVISHQRAPTASAGAFGRPEYSHNFFCSACRPRCNRDITVPILIPRIDATSLYEKSSTSTSTTTIRIGTGSSSSARLTSPPKPPSTTISSADISCTAMPSRR